MPEDKLIQTSNEIFAYSGLMLKFFNQGLERRLQKYGVSVSSLQYNIVRMLTFERLTISTISQRMDLDPSALVRMIDSLENKGLVVRNTDPNDRRRNPIQITQDGLDLVNAVPVISVDDPIYAAMQSLGVEPSIKLRDLLSRVIRQFPEGRLVSEVMSNPHAVDVKTNTIQHDE